jgi:aryl-alcohol dehydrogenase-like predicted oxidoreductase
MEFTTISGTSVSRIGLGTWPIGGTEWGMIPDQDSIGTCLAMLDHGINLIDTAPIYGCGRAEEIVGKAMRQSGQRDRFYIATKAGLEWAGGEGSGRPGQILANSTASRLRSELEDSLRRLGTDCIDLYQIHWPDTTLPIAETAALLDSFRREGKVCALGVSNFSVRQMEEFQSVAPLASNQLPYNLFERAIDAEVLPWCRRHNVAVLAYSSLCRSLLAGRVVQEAVFPEGDIRRVDPKFQPPRLAQYLLAVSRLDAFAREHYGKSVLELAVRWVLDVPGAIEAPNISVALWGAKRPGQLDAVDGIMGWKLDAPTQRQMEAIVRNTVTDPVGPEYLTPGVRTSQATS